MHLNCVCIHNTVYNPHAVIVLLRAIVLADCQGASAPTQNYSAFRDPLLAEISPRTRKKQATWIPFNVFSKVCMYMENIFAVWIMMRGMILILTYELFIMWWSMLGSQSGLVFTLLGVALCPWFAFWLKLLFSKVCGCTGFGWSRPTPPSKCPIEVHVKKIFKGITIFNLMWHLSLWTVSVQEFLQKRLKFS